MALHLDAIEPGIVAWFDTKVLLADPRLSCVSRQPFRNGPFVCAHIGPGKQVWLELTSRPGPRHDPYLPLPTEWRTGGPQPWQAYTSYCRFEPYIARDVVFTDAARYEHPPWAEHRAWVAPAGIAAIMSELLARNSLTP